MEKTLSHKDQLYSWDVFQSLMDYEILRTIRYPAPLSLICLEMTAHAAQGEAPPSAVSLFEMVVNAQLRSVDIPTRHGTGYLILLPMTNEAGARALCERLLAVFAKEFETKEGQPVKFSLQIGVATHGGGPTVMKETLLQSAEAGLQQSRLKGANTIVAI